MWKRISYNYRDAARRRAELEEIYDILFCVAAVVIMLALYKPWTW